MATKKKPRMPNKKIVKKLTGATPTKPSKKTQRYVHFEKVPRRKKEGWKEVGGGPKSNTRTADLVLMEK